MAAMATSLPCTLIGELGEKETILTCLRLFLHECLSETSPCLSIILSPINLSTFYTAVENRKAGSTERRGIKGRTSRHQVQAQTSDRDDNIKRQKIQVSRYIGKNIRAEREAD